MIKSLQSIQKELPEAVFQKLKSMEPSAQEAFVAEFNKKKKSPFFTSLCGYIGLHYAWVGKVRMTIVFLLTLGGLGIWWLIDLFRIRGIVRNYNNDLAIKVLSEMRPSDR